MFQEDVRRSRSVDHSQTDQIKWAKVATNNAEMLSKVMVNLRGRVGKTKGKGVKRGSTCHTPPSHAHSVLGIT